jgi:hypothetical protein
MTTLAKSCLILLVLAFSAFGCVETTTGPESDDTASAHTVDMTNPFWRWVCSEAPDTWGCPQAVPEPLPSATLAAGQTATITFEGLPVGSSGFEVTLRANTDVTDPWDIAFDFIDDDVVSTSATGIQTYSYTILTRIRHSTNTITVTAKVPLTFTVEDNLQAVKPAISVE